MKKLLTKNDAVAKRPNAAVCKTAIRGFDSRLHLQSNLHGYFKMQEDMTCVMSVGSRSAQRCFVSKRNREWRSARNFCDGNSLLVEDIPA